MLETATRMTDWRHATQEKQFGALEPRNLNEFCVVAASALWCRRGECNPEYTRPLGRRTGDRVTRNTWSQAHDRVLGTHTVRGRATNSVGGLTLGEDADVEVVVVDFVGEGVRNSVVEPPGASELLEIGP